jgi:hypothetical protein
LSMPSSPKKFWVLSATFRVGSNGGEVIRTTLCVLSVYWR